MRLLATLLIALSLCGCANYLAERQAYLNTLIGLHEAELVQALGVPTRTLETGDTKFLAYTETRFQVVPPTPLPSGPWVLGDPFYPAQLVTWVCETTFTLGGGVVRSYTLRGNGCGWW